MGFTSDLPNYRMEKIVQGQGIWRGFDLLPDGSILAKQRSARCAQFPTQGDHLKIEDAPPVWCPCGESGMFDLRLPPNYAENGWIYIAIALAAIALPLVVWAAQSDERFQGTIPVD